MSKLLEVRNLSISYKTNAGNIQAVRDISFSVEQGKAVAIVGESGCGKSVTAKSILGLINEPGKMSETSCICFEGKEITKFNEKKWQEFRGNKVGMIFQDALIALNPTMKIGNQIMEVLSIHTKLSRVEKKKKAVEMLTLVGIPDAESCMKRYPHELSGGMRQRVMIAAAFINNPRLLLADEPTTALDVTIQAQIIQIMKSLQQQMEMSIILITHDLGIVADFADEIIVMYAGKIVERGLSEDIFYHAKHPYTWALLHAVPDLEMDKQERLATIPGTVPDMIHISEGCAFCNRCPYAMKICSKRSPEEFLITDQHTVNCWLQLDGVNTTDIPFYTEEQRNES